MRLFFIDQLRLQLYTYTEIKEPLTLFHSRARRNSMLQKYSKAVFTDSQEKTINRCEEIFKTLNTSDLTSWNFEAHFNCEQQPHGAYLVSYLIYVSAMLDQENLSDKEALSFSEQKFRKVLECLAITSLQSLCNIILLNKDKEIGSEFSKSSRDYFFGRLRDLHDFLTTVNQNSYDYTSLKELNEDKRINYHDFCDVHSRRPFSVTPLKGINLDACNLSNDDLCFLRTKLVGYKVGRIKSSSCLQELDSSIDIARKFATKIGADWRVYGLDEVSLIPIRIEILEEIAKSNEMYENQQLQKAAKYRSVKNAALLEKKRLQEILP